MQAAVQDGGGNIPAIAGVTAGVLLAGALAAYLVARRKNRTGSTDSVV
jgi:hypothetical protein